MWVKEGDFIFIETIEIGGAELGVKLQSELSGKRIF